MTPQLFSSLAVGNSETLKNYFDFVLSTEQSGEEFPVDFDLVWPLAYSRKDHAKTALVRDFFDGEDYRIDQFPISRENLESSSRGGRPEEQIRLTTKCLEFFIARKVRSIFEIYRQCRVAVTSAPPAPARPLPPSQDTRTLERAVVDFMATRDSFDGTPMELLIELSRFVSDEQFRMADWPRSPQTFGVKVNLMAPNLALRGIDLQRRKSAGLRMLRIRRQMPELR